MKVCDFCQTKVASRGLDGWGSENSETSFSYDLCEDCFIKIVSLIEANKNDRTDNTTE